ncbi:hypothetical protein GJAV_G00092720 [Gymnothorax javanicus]|nr:hypothetical protein GJAV_G00092720 [Gymnothorax javanicus]
MPRPANIQRERAIGMLNTGTSVTDVARVMGCSRRTIHDLRTRLQQTGTTADRPRSGRPRVMTQAEDRQIVLRHLRNQFLTAMSTRNELFRGCVTAQTIRNRLRTARLHARRPHRGPILTQLHRRQWLLWAQRRLRWTQRDWNRVVFSLMGELEFGGDAVNATPSVVCRKWTVLGAVVLWFGVPLMVLPVPD